uniref:SFRICE_012308 n=1 Tax=Spodoptera frugiperda TaxID=7108 RepID=A0A2H1VX20_SPOFR
MWVNSLLQFTNKIRVAEVLLEHILNCLLDSEINPQYLGTIFDSVLPVTCSPSADPHLQWPENVASRDSRCPESLMRQLGRKEVRSLTRSVSSRRRRHPSSHRSAPWPESMPDARGHCCQQYPHDF